MGTKKSKPLTVQNNSFEEKTLTKTKNTLQQFATTRKEKEIPYYIALGCIVLLICVIRKHFLNISFERDEGFYMYSGKALLNGAVPYKQIGSQRLDGVFYIYALLVGIFGYTVKAMHLAFLIINIGTAIFVFFITKKLSNNLTALAASLFFALLSTSKFASGFTIQSEHLVSFFITAAILFLIHFFDDKRILFLFFSGILFSIAFQIKQTSVFYGLLAGFILLFKTYLDQKKDFLTLLKFTAVFSLSVLLPIIFDVLIVYYRGGWEDFNIWFFDIRKQYTETINLTRGIGYFNQEFSKIIINYRYFWILSFLGSFLIYLTHQPIWKKVFITGLYYAGFLTIVPGFHFFGHYFLQWIPAVAISAAISIYSVEEFLLIKIKQKTIPLLVSMMLILLPALANMNNLKNYYFSRSNDQLLNEVYHGNPFADSRVVADKLNSIMKKDDKLVVFGEETELYVYTNKTSPSRFISASDFLQFPIKQSNDWQKEYISDIEKAKPEYLVFYKIGLSWLADPRCENLIFPWFDRFIKDDYELIGYASTKNDFTTFAWKQDRPLSTDGINTKNVIYIFEKK